MNVDAPLLQLAAPLTTGSVETTDLTVRPKVKKKFGWRSSRIRPQTARPPADFFSTK